MGQISAEIPRNTRQLSAENQQPVIVALDGRMKEALSALRGGKPARAVARSLQPYIVQVPPKARELLVRSGHVAFAKDFGDQFAVLRS